MSLLGILLLVLTLVLSVVGAVNRKKLAFWVKATATEVIDNNIDNLKIVKQRISELKTKRKSIVDKAGSLFAELSTQRKSLKELKDKLFNCKKDALKAKNDMNKDLAIIKLKDANILKDQIKMAEDNIQVLANAQTKLENINQELKSQISALDIQLLGLSARKDTNKALASLNFDEIGGENIAETLNTEDIKITKDELKLSYKMEESDLGKESVTSEELENEYESLK